MTRDETKQILYIMTTIWANFRPKLTSEFVNVWHEMLGDMDFRVAAAGLKAYAQQDRSGFAPSVGQLRGAAVDLVKGQEITDAEAWNLVVKAVSRSTYYAEEEFNKLPEAVQRAVGGPDTLRSWAMSEEDLNFARGAFLRSFQTEQDRNRERSQMSGDLLALIDKTMMRLTKKEAAE